MRKAHETNFLIPHLVGNRFPTAPVVKGSNRSSGLEMETCCCVILHLSLLVQNGED